MRRGRRQRARGCNPRRVAGGVGVLCLVSRVCLAGRALMKPRSKSVWMVPAALGAVHPSRIVQHLTSSAPARDASAATSRADVRRATPPLRAGAARRRCKSGRAAACGSRCRRSCPSGSRTSAPRSRRPSPPAPCRPASPAHSRNPPSHARACGTHRPTRPRLQRGRVRYHALARPVLVDPRLPRSRFPLAAGRLAAGRKGAAGRETAGEELARRLRRPEGARAGEGQRGGGWD